ncbi:MAG: crossover junction endodeoxyribonuclease RuvC [Candidatus Doudnabacteria bacterium CG10_big_fil_rev_8_21_14_0_10_41_10]|uniref:Crossover junction endodeoxyribonuclease RuvC n=1 Tax=Candidatus Doudnabacteria bacterium CG10_big_fil_rev_8_21_14_0_10_41_10 TaxID=1974551 RepID=A0A2H0VC60_9BACT|nr:MAG: crossover junction endodeoxyribonuclease RuvC [Candidatus Doudnabacteria bacterium CG10_big_fil_rev_8_21_14_0_10_41_10]
MIILGIDPGLATTGYGIIKMERSKIQPLDWGVIETKKNTPIEKRLEIIADDLKKIIKKYRPQLAVVESVYFAKNVKTAIIVSHARGVILLTLKKHKVKLQELTPLQMKSQITSYGAATKHQVQFMVGKMLNLKTTPRPDDAADALALAICGTIKK